jgi:hypothetical protein
MRRVEVFRWLYFDPSAKVLRLTRQHMTREEAAMRLPEAKPDLKTREVRYVNEHPEEPGTSEARDQWFDAQRKASFAPQAVPRDQ